jgi:putative phosphoesterase
VRVAALSDIHGNLPALEAVLADMAREHVDGVVIVGDTVAGPWPVEVFDLVTALDPSIVRGNVDRAVVERDERLGDGPAWCADRLGEERLGVVASWPLTCELEIPSLGRMLVCHATPESDEPIYTRITPDDELAELFADVEDDVVLCGHTHVQYDRRLSTGLRIVNPGSVGMPYEGVPGAYWAVLGEGVEMRRSEYDVAAAGSAIEELEAPVERLFEVQNLVDPPSGEKATAHFESLRGT